MSNQLTPPPELNITLTRRGRRPSPCKCCGAKTGICSDHRATLAAIRVELELEAKAKGKEGMQKKSPQRPTCNTEGCWAPRVPPLGFCHECIEASE
jgi:hypothetical protein